MLPSPITQDRDPGPGCLLALVASLILWGFVLAGAWLIAQGIHHLLNR